MWKLLLSLWIKTGLGSGISRKAAFGIIFLCTRSNCDVMEILLIVLSLVAAYVVFVAVCYLLIRLIFPKIEVEDEDVKPVKLRNAGRYSAARTLGKQKNLAY